LSLRIHTVLDTRPAASRGFAKTIERAGISVLHVPMIRIEGVEMNEEIAAALKNLRHYDGLLLTSMNAVRCFAALLREARIAPELLPPVFVVGPKTGELARKEGFAPQALPSESYGAMLAAELPDVRDRRFLQPCGDIARDEVAAGIRERGGSLEQLVVYRTLPPIDTDAARLMEAAGSAAYDCVAFFSPSAVRHYTAILKETERPAAAIAVIGNTTAAEAEACGMQVDIVPTQQTAEAMAEAIVAWTMD
jgi:uroporphyrinogen-III synthase